MNILTKFEFSMKVQKKPENKAAVSKRNNDFSQNF